MLPLDSVGVAAVVIVGAAASAFDLKTGRVPNWLTLGAAGAGLAAGALRGGAEGVWQAFLGAVLGFALLLVPAVLGWVGGGDCKFLAALGAFLGPWGVLHAGAYGAAAGGIGAIAAMLAGNVRENLRALVCCVVVAAGGGRAALPQAKKAFPYVPFLAIGGVLTAVLK